LTGSSAGVAGWFCRALSAFSACEDDVPAAAVVLVAVNGVQPSAGFTNASSRPSSLPLFSFVAPARFATLAAVFWAVCPVFGLNKYDASTLSLWSWSISGKLVVVSQGWPSLPVPVGGTTSVPAAISWLASW
jgi:hypothetical protein